MSNRAKIPSIALGAGLALTLLAPAARATTTDWGVHGAVESSTEHVAKGSFEDVFSFTLPSMADLSSFAISFDQVVFTGPPPKEPKSIFDIDNGNVKLYQGVFGDATPDTLKLSYDFDDEGGISLHTLGPLTPGKYFYEVSGNAESKGGGFFNLTSALAPVPEPETYGMLLAGLGLMGFVARRRRAADS